MGLRVVKGHGTGNDFVLVPDPDGDLDVGVDLVRALCDRHTGVGGDGVLRVVRTAHCPEVADQAGDAEWFMDYRNADGSVAEMCGNGLRVVGRYLFDRGLVGHSAAVATRGGTMRVRFTSDGDVSVALGKPRVLADRPVVTAAHRDPLPGTAVLVPNPHVVVEVDDPAALDLTQPPVVTPAMPEGQNIEFIRRLGPRHVQMRVHERGVGETLSCGTGIVAVVAAVGEPDGTTWQVDVPGGTCRVVWDEAGLELSGPAVLVGEIELTDSWLSGLGLTGLMASTGVSRWNG